MLPAAWLLVSLLAVADAGRPAPEIRAANGAVTIHVEHTPLSQILDRLASATGMKLTYEGTRPSAPVSMSVDGISETEAILKLMEGVGVSYVLRTDEAGQRVDLLIVSGAGAGKLVAAAPSSAAPAEAAYEEPVGDYGHIPLDPAVVEAAGPQVKPDLNSPFLGLPAQHFPQANQPQGDPTGSAQGSGSRSFPGPGGVSVPSFPTGASYPAR